MSSVKVNAMQMKIGQFTDTFLPIVDGVGRVVQAYSETLCRMGHQVTVVAPMYDTGFQGGFPYQLVEYVASSVPRRSGAGRSLPAADPDDRPGHYPRAQSLYRRL